MDNDEIRAVEQAMGAIRLIRDTHRSSETGQKLSQEILEALRGDRKSLLRTNVAEAINASLLNKSVAAVPAQAA